MAWNRSSNSNLIDLGNMKSISYSSGIFNENNEYSVLESSFTLVKQFNCFTKDNLNLMITVDLISL